MARTLEVDWQQSERELHELYRREANPHRRTRLQSLWLLRQNKSIKEVAPVVGMHYRTVQSWVAWYRQGGLAEVLRRTPGYAAPGKKAFLTAAQQRALLARVAQGQFKTVWHILEWVEDRWGMRYTYHGMYDFLKRHQAGLKVPRPHAEKASPEAREAWKKGG
jgi:transposase